ncbi:MAG: hypothetical protein SOT80_07650 [Candidatus Pseudoruminococcus sp.]|nr:hypothetical protein [Ruminococcus sp.]MDY2783262.1 hypothetical protein [Candidatus Pseudoruminococcus sp.]
MKNSKKQDSGGAMKLSVWCFVIFLLITALQLVIKIMLPMVGDIYFYALSISFVLQMLTGIISVIAFIISCIKRKALSFGFAIITIIMLGFVIGEGYLGMPYINDFKNKTTSVITSDYSVIGKENNKSIYFADNKNKEEALRLDKNTLSYLENNNAIDVNNSYVSNTSYLHHINYIDIEYYPNTGILKKITVIEQ